VTAADLVEGANTLAVCVRDAAGNTGSRASRSPRTPAGPRRSPTCSRSGARRAVWTRRAGARGRRTRALAGGRQRGRRAGAARRPDAHRPAAGDFTIADDGCSARVLAAGHAARSSSLRPSAAEPATPSAGERGTGAGVRLQLSEWEWPGDAPSSGRRRGATPGGVRLAADRQGDAAAVRGGARDGTPASRVRCACSRAGGSGMADRRTGGRVIFGAAPPSSRPLHPRRRRRGPDGRSRQTRREVVVRH